MEGGGARPGTSLTHHVLSQDAGHEDSQEDVLEAGAGHGQALPHG
jgi:hypothetical protein